MKRRSFLLAVVLCMTIGGAVWVVRGRSPRPELIVTLQGFTNGVPNWTVDDWFIRTSPERARLMQEWFKSGTNAVRFKMTNVSIYAIRIFPIAQFETPAQH